MEIVIFFFQLQVPFLTSGSFQSWVFVSGEVGRCSGSVSLLEA